MGKWQSEKCQRQQPFVKLLPSLLAWCPGHLAPCAECRNGTEIILISSVRSKVSLQSPVNHNRNKEGQIGSWGIFLCLETFCLLVFLVVLVLVVGVLLLVLLLSYLFLLSSFFLLLLRCKKWTCCKVHSFPSVLTQMTYITVDVSIPSGVKNLSQTWPDGVTSAPHLRGGRACSSGAAVVTDWPVLRHWRREWRGQDGDLQVAGAASDELLR